MNYMILVQCTSG